MDEHSKLTFSHAVEEKVDKAHQPVLDPLARFRGAAHRAVKATADDNGGSAVIPSEPQKTVTAFDPSPKNLQLVDKTKTNVAQMGANGRAANGTPLRPRMWQRCRRFYRHFGLKHVGFGLVLVIYSFFGGWLFSILELDNEFQLKLNKTLTLKQEAQNFSEVILLKFFENGSMTDFNGSDLNFARFLQDQMIKYQIDHKMYPDDKVTWDLWGGMFFAGTVYTTIGYGHYCPVTFYGRIAVMVYALFGIPMLLTLLADMGKLLTQFLNRLYTSFRKFLATVLRLLWRRKCEKTVTKAQMTSEFNFPIPLALSLIVAWIFFCSSLFCLWENTWDYFDAFYFFFISLSTVGLGDLTPRHPKYMICNFPLVIIGLTLVTLVVNLIQNKIEILKRDAANLLESQLGLDADTESETDDEAADRNVGQAPNPETFSRVTLGVIQTMQRSRVTRRRRRGVQTDESFLKDSQNMQIHSNFDFKQKNHRNDQSPEREILMKPRGLAHSVDTVYFDAV